MIGEKISHYKIIEKLGEGGMGVVYKAEDLKLKRTVALKFLSPEFTRDSQAKERFVHEAQTASALDHSHICTIHEIEETEDGQIFICMAHYGGESLKERIEGGPLDAAEAVQIACQIADGLERAHERGIVHRDIKPGNIIITDRGEVKIVDFGLAKLAGRTRLTTIGTTLGTVAYMSPEQTKGKDVDSRTDIWSLGAVLYEMLTGQVPFKGGYEQAIIYSILNEEPEPMTSKRTDVSSELQAIVDRCLTKNAEQRYQTAAEVLDDLMMTDAAQTATAISISQSKSRKRKRAKWMKVGLPAAIAAVAVVIVLLAVNAWRSSLRLSERSDSDLLKDGERVTALSPAQSVAGFDYSIVVLPFEDISPGKDNEYFSDGLTEEIITDLSRISSLRVISRTSAMNYKGSEKDVRTIGHELNVRYVLEGSVRKIDGDLRITAQLIDAKSDAHIWAEKYRGTLDDVFDIQEKVSRAITSALKLTLSEEEEKTMTHRPIDDVIAYEHYFRAKQEIRTLTPEGLDRARTYIRAGLDRIGDNVLLYQGMGLIEWEYYSLGLSSEDAYLDKAEGYATKIFELEPDSPSGYFLLSLVDIARGNPRKGAENLHRVLAVEPRNCDAMLWLIVIYSYTGKVASAVSVLERFAEIDPIASNKMLCWLGLMDGSFKEFHECASKLYQQDPNNLAARLHYILAAAYAGELEHFHTLVDQLAEEMPRHFAANLLMFMSYAFQKRSEEALQVMTSKVDSLAERSWQYAWHVAAGYAMMSENEKAVEWLERAVNLGFINYPMLAEIDPFLENARQEKAFASLMERVKREWERFER